jgi:hypothetical protein
MPQNFDLDHKEYFHIDQYATAYQQKYGIPNYDEVNWNMRPVPWDKINKRICEDVFHGNDGFKTTIDNPKEKKHVSQKEKDEITLNKI